jgi:Ca-activated chloride channel family protein
MNEAFQNFHFLRPACLLLLPVAAGCWWWLRRQGDPLRSWRRLIDPDLLRHLAQDDNPQANPVGFALLTLWVVLVIAVAGPTWRQAPSPFGENDRALLVVLKASESMDVTDLVPSRLERARLEIADLAKERPGLPMGLVTYAGSAHLVLPPTRDTSLVSTMAANIETDVLPVPGDDLLAAMNLAEETLAKTPVGGAILLLADSIPAEQSAGLSAWRRAHRTPVMILPLVAQGSDDGTLRAAAKLLKAAKVPLAAHHSDTEEIIRRADRAPVRQADAESGSQWEEAGYWLTPLAAILILLGFRRVGPRSGNAPTPAAVVPAVMIALGMLLSAPPARAGEADPTESPQRSWFFTPDQLGHRLFAKGDYQAAAVTFVDAQWQGLSWFRAGDFKRAEQAFSRGSSPEAFFNRGNALVMLGKYAAAAEQFTKALEARPGWSEAEENRTLAELRAKMTEQKGGDMGDQQIGADKIVFEPGKGKKNPEGQDTEVSGDQALDDKSMQALWLRNVQTKPSDFLRAKFSYQEAMKSQTGTPAEPEPATPAKR